MRGRIKLGVVVASACVLSAVVLVPSYGQNQQPQSLGSSGVSSGIPFMSGVGVGLTCERFQSMETRTDDMRNFSADAAVAQGYVLTGGGCASTTPAAANGTPSSTYHLTASYPINVNSPTPGWRCIARTENAMEAVTVIAYAVGCRMVPVGQ